VPIPGGSIRQHVGVTRRLGRRRTTPAADGLVGDATQTVAAVADTAPLVASLVGHKIESVVFVMDYAQITLWGPGSSPCLTFNVWPRLDTFGEVRVFGDKGYRDAVCGLIGRSVTAASESQTDGLVLRFDPDSLSVNPEPSDLRGPEIAMLSMNDAGQYLGDLACR
jgi:hypothetical protein